AAGGGAHGLPRGPGDDRGGRSSRVPVARGFVRGLAFGGGWSAGAAARRGRAGRAPAHRARPALHERQPPKGDRAAQGRARDLLSEARGVRDQEEERRLALTRLLRASGAAIARSGILTTRGRARSSTPIPTLLCSFRPRRPRTRTLAPPLHTPPVNIG